MTTPEQRTEVVETSLDMPTEKERYVQGLRDMADFIESAHFDFADATLSAPTHHVFCKTSLVFGNNVRALGKCRKGDSDLYVNADREFGPFILQVTAQHKYICEKVKTGERVIEAKPEVVIEAKPEEILPAVPKRVEEIYEWKCPDSFLALGKEEAEKGGPR